MRPDTVLATALDKFFGSILEISKVVGNVQASLKWRISDILGSTDNNPFLEMLPNLKAWLSEGSTQFSATQSQDIVVMGSSGLTASSQRVKYLFCKLIGAMASRSSPLVRTACQGDYLNTSTPVLTFPLRVRRSDTFLRVS